jgi:hypothetical protein
MSTGWAYLSSVSWGDDKVSTVSRTVGTSCGIEVKYLKSKALESKALLKCTKVKGVQAIALRDSSSHLRWKSKWRFHRSSLSWKSMERTGSSLSWKSSNDCSWKPIACRSDVKWCKMDWTTRLESTGAFILFQSTVRSKSVAHYQSVATAHAAAES